MKKILLLIILPLIQAASLFSIDISVSATNKTLNKPAASADKVTIIHLNQTMQVVAVKTDPALPVRFSDLPPMENAPYMVQVTLQGVNYNKVIPPNTTENSIDVNIDVYNVTNSFHNNLKFETFIEINYFTGVLATDITYHFINTGRATISERGGNKGVLVYSPRGQNLEAIATLESLHGTSDIKTIKLNPTALADKPGYYLLEQPIKPGEKYYQTRAHYKYDGSPLEVTFENIYPLSTTPAVILHSKNMQVSLKDNPSVTLKREFNESMGADYVTLPNKPGKYTLVFTGGEPEKAPAGSGKSGKSGKSVEVSPALQKEFKIGGVLLFVILTTALFYHLRSKPAWLQVMQAKNLSRLQFELENLQKLNLPAEVKAKKEEALKAKINSLNKFLGS